MTFQTILEQTNHGIVTLRYFLISLCWFFVMAKVTMATFFKLQVSFLILMSIRIMLTIPFRQSFSTRFIMTNSISHQTTNQKTQINLNQPRVKQKYTSQHLIVKNRKLSPSDPLIHQLIYFVISLTFKLQTI